MTVAELIAALAALPPGLEVVAEGCDCENAVHGAQVEPIWVGKRGDVRAAYVLLTIGPSA